MEKFENKEEPAAGKLLISEPFLEDPNFRRTVVLLCEHTAEGSVGFILNKPFDAVLTDVLDIKTDLQIPLFFGGPVKKNSLHFIHMDESIASTSEYLGEGMYWGGDFELVSEKIENNTLDTSLYRFFAGYSGWGTGQLDDELESHSWIVCPSNPEMVFHSDEDSMWKEVLKQMGGSFKVYANSPESPQLN